VTVFPHFESNVSYSASVNVIPKITTNIPQSPFSVRGLEHLQVNPLADPSFNIPQEIDMLLGAEFFYFIMQPEKRSGPTGSPFAIASIFGWIIGGGSDARPNATSLMLIHVGLQLLTQF